MRAQAVKNATTGTHWTATFDSSGNTPDGETDTTIEATDTEVQEAKDSMKIGETYPLDEFVGVGPLGPEFYAPDSGKYVVAGISRSRLRKP